jgi:hypothetical protein
MDESVLEGKRQTRDRESIQSVKEKYEKIYSKNGSMMVAEDNIEELKNENRRLKQHKQLALFLNQLLQDTLDEEGYWKAFVRITKRKIKEGLLAVK